MVTSVATEKITIPGLGIDEVMITHEQIKKLSSLRPYKNEKHVVNSICENIKLFVSEILEDTYVSHEIEKPVKKQVGRLSPRGRRIDLYIEAEKHNYVIEVKCPNSLHEIRGAIGQLLDYGREFNDPKKKLILISTKFCSDTAKTINYYELPITYIYLLQDWSLIYRASYGKS